MKLGDTEHAQKLIDRELELFQRRNPRSYDLFCASYDHLPGGVISGVSVLDPFPIAVDRGEGAYVWDVDGHRYVDYNNAFGSTVHGHAHPAVVAAIKRQAEQGTHFGVMTPVAERWANHLCRRYGLSWVRAVASGTEATMDALRLARAFTGRVKIAKIDGGYHGAHPDALVSTCLPLDGSEGPDDDRPAARFFGKGVSPRLLDEVVVLPFNNLDAAERELAAGDVAALIVEPILFNIGAIFPQPDYLEGLREICNHTGTLLIFDETKTAATAAYGGAEELFGVTPDIKTLGKGVGGGLPCGVIGDTSGKLRTLVEEWQAPTLGTFSGNPLTAAAGLAALTEVLTPEAFVGLNLHYHDLSGKLEQVIAEFDLPAYVVGVGAKGCVVWADPAGGKLRDHRDYQRRFDMELGYLAWIWLMNRGLFMCPGHDEQWTASVFHGTEEADLFANGIRELAQALRFV